MDQLRMSHVMTRLHPLIHMNDLNSNESLMSWEWVMWWRGYTLLITLRIHEGHFTYEWASSPHNSFMRVVSHMNATYECAMNTNVTCECAMNVTYECAMNDIQPIAFEVSFNLNLQYQSNWPLFNGTWQKRPRGLYYRLRFAIQEMTLQMQ